MLIRKTHESHYIWYIRWLKAIGVIYFIYWIFFSLPSLSLNSHWSNPLSSPPRAPPSCTQASTCSGWLRLVYPSHRHSAPDGILKEHLMLPWRPKGSWTSSNLQKHLSPLNRSRFHVFLDPIAIYSHMCYFCFRVLDDRYFAVLFSGLGLI